MFNVNAGTAFSAGIGLALGLTMANYMFSIMKPPEKIVKQVILCQKCGNKNPAENKFCNECGRPLYPQPQIRCPKCGAITTATMNFCGACGTLLKK